MFLCCYLISLTYDLHWIKQTNTKKLYLPVYLSWMKINSIYRDGYCRYLPLVFPSKSCPWGHPQSPRIRNYHVSQMRLGSWTLNYIYILVPNDKGHQIVWRSCAPGVVLTSLDQEVPNYCENTLDPEPYTRYIFVHCVKEHQMVFRWEALGLVITSFEQKINQIYSKWLRSPPLNHIFFFFFFVNGYQLVSKS